MKKFIVFLTTFSLVANAGLFAQEAPVAKTPDATAAVQTAASVPVATAPNPTGSSAVQSTQTATRSTSWHNWIFAGTALAIVVAGAIIVSLDSGADAH